jgi:hypothetical protein
MMACARKVTGSQARGQLAFRDLGGPTPRSTGLLCMYVEGQTQRVEARSRAYRNSGAMTFVGRTCLSCHLPLIVCSSTGSSRGWHAAQKKRPAPSRTGALCGSEHRPLEAVEISIECTPAYAGNRPNIWAEFLGQFWDNLLAKPCPSMPIGALPNCSVDRENP